MFVLKFCNLNGELSNILHQIYVLRKNPSFVSFLDVYYMYRMKNCYHKSRASVSRTSMQDFATRRAIGHTPTKALREKQFVKDSSSGQ